MSRLYTAWKNNSAARTSFSTGSGKYLRIKSAQLGYTLPDKVSDKIRLKDVRVYVSGLNLYMWSSEEYLDPDNRDYRGGLMPPLRTFNCGINIKF